MEKVKAGGAKNKSLVKNILAREKLIISNSIAATESILKNFESRYKMKSSSFFKKYVAGEMGDYTEVMMWAAQVRALEKLKADLSKISGVKIVS